MIVIGYQGIGKSTLSQRSFKYIDLESSALRKGDVRWHNWYEPYCMIAEWLSRQGYTVFVSSHKEVRDYLNEFCEEPFCAVVPSEDIKDEWIERLRERHKRLPTDKNYRAYMNAVDRFTENVREIKKDVADVREIDSMTYELDKLIEKADTPQTDCETCKHYNPHHEAIACERCLDGKYSRYEPQTECRTCKWALVSWTSHHCDGCEAHSKYEPYTDCGWGKPE